MVGRGNNYWVGEEVGMDGLIWLGGNADSKWNTDSKCILIVLNIFLFFPYRKLLISNTPKTTHHNHPIHTFHLSPQQLHKKSSKSHNIEITPSIEKNLILHKHLLQLPRQRIASPTITPPIHSRNPHLLSLSA
jgi:hypothetical protein